MPYKKLLTFFGTAIATTVAVAAAEPAFAGPEAYWAKSLDGNGGLYMRGWSSNAQICPGLPYFEPPIDSHKAPESLDPESCKPVSETTHRMMPLKKYQYESYRFYGGESFQNGCLITPFIAFDMPERSGGLMEIVWSDCPRPQDNKTERYEIRADYDFELF